MTKAWCFICVVLGVSQPIQSFSKEDDVLNLRTVFMITAGCTTLDDKSQIKLLKRGYVPVHQAEDWLDVLELARLELWLQKFAALR